MMLAALHSSHRAGDQALLGAWVGQMFKATEAAIHARGRWDLAWQYTGLPEVRPRLGQMRGLTHPAEWAAAVARGKEFRALKESLSAHGSHGDRNGPKKGGQKGGKQ